MSREILVIFLLGAISPGCHGYEPRPPRLVEEPMDTVVARHQPATLECRAEGEPPPTIHWYKDGLPLGPGGAGGARRVLLPAGGLFFLRATHARRDTDQGVYWCEASNRLGTARSRNATLQVAVLREDFRLEPADTRGAAGDSALLECAPPRGAPEPAVLWKKNGQIMDLEDNERIKIVDGGNLIIQDLRQADDGRYQCLAKNIVGTRESAVAHLRVHVKPYLIVGPSDAIVLVGGSVTFKCRVGGDPLPDVLWRRAAGGGNMPLGRVHILEDRSLRLEAVELEDQGEYSCEADNTVGSVTATGILKVHSPPYLDVKPVTQSVEIGSEAFYECLANGNPRPTLFWSLEGNHSLIFPGITWDRYRASISIDGKSLLTLQSANKMDSGTTVVCSAVNSAGAITSRAKLIVTSEDDRPPPVIILGPSNQTLPIKSIAEFQCKALGNPDPIISWYHKSTPLLPSNKVNITNTGTLAIKHLDKEDSGVYSCVASNKNGKYVWSAFLKVDSPTNPSVNFFRGPDPSTFPGIPSRPQIRNQSESSVTISWTQNNKIGSSSLLGYQVEMFARDNLAGGKYEAKWIIVARRIQEPSYTQRTLSVGGAYIFLIRAENSHGLSPPSSFSETILGLGDNEVLIGVDDGFGSALIAEARASLQADEVVHLNDAIPVDSSRIKLAWETINAYNLEGFYIYYRPLDSPNATVGEYSMQTVLHSGSASGFAISALLTYTSYEFFLVPFYKNIDGRPSNSRVARTLEGAPYEPPNQLEAFLLNSTSVYLKWKPPPQASHNGIIQYYQIVVKESGNESHVVHNMSVVGVNTKLGHLTPGTAYWLQLAAATSRGVGPYSPPAALRLPSTPSNEVDASSKLLDPLHRNTLEQNPQQVDAGDLLTETWFLVLVGSMITIMIILFIGTFAVRRRLLLAKKSALPNLYDTRSVGSNLITQLNIKGTPGLPSNLTTSYNHSNITKTDSLMWMDTRPDTWRQSSKILHAMTDYSQVNGPITLPDYDKFNGQNMPDYAEVDAAMICYRKTSLDDSKNSPAAYASVPVLINDKQNAGTLGWMKMCTGSRNKVIEEAEEEVYPATNGGYYNRNVFSETYFSSDRSNMFKFDNLPPVEVSNQSSSNAANANIYPNPGVRPVKERTYSLPQTPCSTIRRSHRLQMIRSQNEEKGMTAADAPTTRVQPNSTYHEIRTQENPTFALFDDQNCRLSDMPDDEKVYIGHIQPMKLISNQYSRPSIARASPTNKSNLTSFSTLKNSSHVKPEYHSSTRSEPGNH